MKRLCLLLLLLPLLSYSQKSKRVDVTRNAVFTVSSEITYNEENIPVDTFYYMLGRDSRYSSIIEYITVKHGSLKDVYDLVSYSTDFVKTEDDGVSMDYSGNRISVVRYSGFKTLFIYGMGDDSNGYTMCNKGQLEKIKAGIESFASKNNVNIK